MTAATQYSIVLHRLHQKHILFVVILISLLIKGAAFINIPQLQTSITRVRVETGMNIKMAITQSLYVGLPLNFLGR